MSVTYQSFLKSKVGGDVILYELEPSFNRESAAIDNTAGTSVLVVPPGYPLAGDTPLSAAQITAVAGNSSGAPTITGILIEEARVPPGQINPVAVLARGPAVIDLSGLPTVDLEGDPIDADDLADALATLSGIVQRSDQSKRSVQTT